MREILFRGKRRDNGEWIEGAFCPKSSDTIFGKPVDRPSIIKIDDPYSGFWFDVDSSTVSQYTGLKDKNGERIFEGDIVRITDRYLKALDWTVEHRNCNFFVKHPLCDYWWSISELDGYTLEVTGNIHDNPELLGGDG